MTIQENISLKSYNTFGIDVKARFFVEITGLAQLQKVLELTAYPKRFIISGGSNMLLTKDIDALVMHIALKGISITEENGETVEIKAMAGENWHNLVMWSLDRGYGGLENLSLIPGNVGTAPIQNIGAYGVELKDIFVSCTAMDVETGELVAFDKENCEFGYRDSIFKNGAKNKYIITSVNLRLTKKDHVLHTGYGAIEEELKNNGIVYPTIRDISNAVIAIRQSKLPDPKELGNSGSFFKNPVISKKKFDKFIKSHPKAPFYELDDDQYKIPAGWLIEQSGFKGKRFGDAGVHEKQALVLVNYGNATGKEILQLAENIQKEVQKNFGINIHPEVNIIK
ncbi:UDP-N-acetylmuramate dehydrogenase [Flagellimonas taeanensis]|uniref:UDP-N-acetylmuramate dehydrogenase n=1 Tax=Flavobacteriaceae TaxID=49546 RepID=UPI000E69B99A|nr:MULTISPECIES: UDP-N-acetylmuramate dehydrogenase [Allomuricauda]MDC6384375.1 UDP-N-acetylmuramate dehydrogenase [Muricauda sp. SK9]MEE1962455.1 UDP-N-acetylmuramate dehydrogenase [Allomuricauda taeanensis]RIV49725.1 UDP-N-acetylmuramate dehydrogenase [Allomuricauda taeanensis]RIV53924.1 UDP-N-acetylmuramate dehydrogenase [Allomuricauda taeanensis]